jgi:23S rRNA A1618 N6-methylase RlmF
MKYASSFRPVAFAVMLAMTSVSAMAAADPQELTIRDIVTQQTQLRAQVTAGKGAFKDMGKAERAALAERQDRVLQMLGGSQSIDEMLPDQRTVVFNDLEWIKAAVSKAEDERKVCEYTRTVGSNRMVSVCMTAGERREITERTKSQVRQGQGCAIRDTGLCRGD